MNIKKKFLSFVIPSVVAMWVFSLYTMVDGIFIANFVSEEALGGVNIVMPFVNFIFGGSLLIASGASVVVSTMKGAGEDSSARETFTGMSVFLAIIAITITIAVQMNAQAIAIFLGATPALMQYAMDYLSIISLFVFPFMLSYYFEVFTRVDNFPRLATYGVTFCALANCFFNYIFLVYFDMGVGGCALGSGVAQCISFAIFFLHFSGKKTSLSWRFKGINLKVVLKAIPLGIADCITEFSLGIIVLIFNRRILHLMDETGIISYSATVYITTIIIMTMLGISQGMQPLMSFYNGAKETAICKHLYRLSNITVLITSIFLAAAAYIFAPIILRMFFSPDLPIFAATVPIFRIVSISYLFIGTTIVASGLYISLENTFFGSLLAISRIAFTVLGLYTLTMLGDSAVWYAPAFGEGIAALLAVALYFLYGKKYFEKPLTN